MAAVSYWGRILPDTAIWLLFPAGEGFCLTPTMAAILSGRTVMVWSGECLSREGPLDTWVMRWGEELEDSRWGRID